jgi:hypothetical protein
MSSDNVVTMGGDSISAANSEVLDSVEKLLETVGNGDVVGMTFVLLHLDNSASAETVGLSNNSMLGVIERMKFRLMQSMDEAND